MGRTTTQVEETLNSTALKECCVANAFKSINKMEKDPRLATWCDAQHSKNKVHAVNVSTIKDADTYLAKGSDLVKSAPWAGVCQTFACASAFLINKNCSRVARIELFSFGSKFAGHVFLVLNRDAHSAPDDPRTWGGALVVDIWHAIQAGTPDKPVYKGGEYFTWLLQQSHIKRQLLVK